jgi:two-component system chemotaxis response regulator CheB
MPKPRAHDLRLLVADPDPDRRRRLVSLSEHGGVIQAASLPEAYDLAESQEPDAVALAVELSGDAGLPMFIRLVDALSASFVMFGDETRDRTPARFRKSIEFVRLGPRDRVDAVIAALRGPGPAANEPSGPPRAAAIGPRPRLIAIGASTGGVSALETVLTAFPADCPPTMVVQHIRAGFIDGMIARLDQRCRPRVVAARDGAPVEPGTIYVAADADRHLVISSGAPPRCHLRAEAPRHGHRPSVDALFDSCVAMGDGVAAALLTGMGADGAAGMARVRSAGGITIAQDEASCVVYGMPRVAVETGAAAMILPLDRIAGGLLGTDRPECRSPPGMRAGPNSGSAEMAG